MTTITNTPTGGNLTVNGNTQVSGTISWSKPTMPNGATISPCVLTGTAKASMSKGSATITVNGTTVTSGTSFTINLGTANNTTSVITTAKVGWDRTFNSVISDLTITAQYEKIPESSEEPDNNELVQGDINEDGSFNDGVSTIVRAKYIDISDKKSIVFNVLTDNVYISACYLYNVNKELVKVIEIPADKKRIFGVNLQELIVQILNNEGSDQ